MPLRYKYSLIWNFAVWYSLFLNQPIFQENRTYHFKIHLFSFWYTKQINDGTFLKRTGIIWQKLSETWESDFKMLSFFCICSLNSSLEVSDTLLYFSYKYNLTFSCFCKYLLLKIENIEVFIFFEFSDERIIFIVS